jgi:hypothetical protein
MNVQKRDCRLLIESRADIGHEFLGEGEKGFGWVDGSDCVGVGWVGLHFLIVSLALQLKEGPVA